MRPLFSRMVFNMLRRCRCWILASKLFDRATIRKAVVSVCKLVAVPRQPLSHGVETKADFIGNVRDVALDYFCLRKIQTMTHIRVLLVDLQRYEDFEWSWSFHAVLRRVDAGLLVESTDGASGFAMRLNSKGKYFCFFFFLLSFFFFTGFFTDRGSLYLEQTKQFQGVENTFRCNLGQVKVARSVLFERLF